MKLVKIIFVLSTLAALPLFSGCSLDEATTGGGGGGGGGGAGGDDGETENIPSTENFQVDVNTNSNYTVVISKGGDGTTDCIAEEGEDILCVVDMYELDMYMRGYTLNVAFPPDLCEYSGFYPYFYNHLPFGYSPDAVYYNTDAEGNLAAPVHFGLTGDPADIYYNIAGDWISHATIYGEAAASDGNMRCPWDYSKLDSDYPNCCSGKYTLYTASEGDLSDSEDSWGGKIGECFEGPGIREYSDNGGALDDDGLPVYRMTALDGETGDTYTFKTSSPFSQSLWLGFGQFYAANYYNSSQHGGAGRAPGGTETIGSLYSSIPSVINSSAHYQYDCFDQAMEVKARIRVVAREWNEYSEFLGFLTSGTGNAETTGTETSPTQEGGDTSAAPEASYLNDFADWADISSDNSDVTFRRYGLPLSFFFGGDTNQLDDYVVGPHTDYMNFYIIERRQ
jgi:hypothetical protein